MSIRKVSVFVNLLIILLIAGGLGRIEAEPNPQGRRVNQGGMSR